MQRFFLQLSYDGTNFHGWQTQPNAITIQQEIEKSLSLLLQKKVSITGCGRTDSGVHARNFYAHFDVEDNDINLITKKIPFSINKILPPEIAIENLIPTTPDANARFDAISRTYKYYVALKKRAIGKDYCTTLYGDIDFELMNKAAIKLFDYSDFTSFSKLHTQTFTNNCKITEANWKQENDLWVFTIKADRFLRNMVRAIVGTLLEVGRKKITIDDFCEIIKEKNRNSAGTSVPAKALFLEDIEYSEGVFLK